MIELIGWPLATVLIVFLVCATLLGLALFSHKAERIKAELTLAQLNTSQGNLPPREWN